ncbi:MAG: HAD-IIA family hydrolase [Bacillota bacterium]
MGNINEIDCFLLDMDGTFYLGEELISGALEFIDILKEKDKKFVFLTNNSSRNSYNYQKKLKKLGLQVPLKKIVTSGQVTADYIKNENKEALVYIVGTEKLKNEFTKQGLKVTQNKDDNPDFLVVGFDTSLTYKKLWDAHDLILAGTDYIATNPDRVCPLAGGATMPDCGAIIELLKTSTGQKPLVIGKPNTIMVDYISRKLGIARKKMALIGDRLYTDIEMANQADISSVLVLSGETKKKDLQPAEQVPDFVYNSIKDIYLSLADE